MVVMAGITFVSAGMLFGGLLAALPIAAHLMNRRARRRIVFPTIRLLEQASAGHSRLFKARRWVLLMLRVLAVWLIALAFSRPMWTAAETGGESGEGRSVVLVLDTSASVGRRQEGVRLIHPLRAAALRALDELNIGVDAADLVYADAHPHALVRGLTRNPQVLREALGELIATNDRADIRAAFTLADALLKGQAGTKQVLVFSDIQATNWKPLLAAGDTATRLLSPDIRMKIVAVGNGDTGNVALSDAFVFPPHPIVGQTVRLHVRVVNYGTSPRRVEVSARLDSETPLTRVEALSPEEQREMVFPIVVDLAGEHDVVFTLSCDDALAVDNRFYFSFRCSDRLPVVLVSDDDPNQPGSGGYFLLRALAPRGRERDPLSVRHISSDEVTRDSLTDAQAVVIGYTRLLSAGAPLFSALREYLERGGGMAWFAAEGPAAHNLRTFTAMFGSEAFGFEIGPVRDYSATGAALSITRGLWDSSLLDMFDLRSQETLGRIRLTRGLMIGSVSGYSAPLLSFSDGSPALMSIDAEDGRFVLAGFSPSVSCGDLGKHGVFVALCQSLIQYLRPAHTERDVLRVGQPVEFPLTGIDAEDAGVVRDITVIAPDGRPGDIQITGADGHLVATVAVAREPGFYRLRRVGRVLKMLPVNIDPRESNLAPLDDSDFGKLSHSVVSPSKDTGRVANVPLLTGAGRPLWRVFLAAGVVVLGCEMLLQSVWKR